MSKLTALFLFLLAGFVFSQPEQIFEIGIDRDNNSLTGCDWVLEDSTVVPGIDLILVTTVRQVDFAPRVVSVQLRQCSGGSFGSPFSIDNGSWPVGSNNGVDLGDVIETYIPLTFLGATSSIRLTYQVQSSSGSSSKRGGSGLDTLLTFSGDNITYIFPFPIPTLTQWGLALLVILMLGVSLWIMRRYRKLGRGALVSLILFSTILLLALGTTFMADGDVSDWTDIGPLATDAAGDSGDDATDLLAVFAGNDESNLYLRCDVTDSENVAPIADDLDSETLEDSAVVIELRAEDANGDDLDFSIVTLPAHGTLGPISRQTSDTRGVPDTANVTYTPDLDYHGDDGFTFLVDDGRGGTDQGDVDVEITSVNDEPGFTTGANISILKDLGPQTETGWASDISAGPPNESTQALTFTLSNDNTDLFSVQPAVDATGTLTFTVAPDANGAATVTLFLTDDGGTGNGGDDTSPSDTFTIIVGSVNDPPTFNAGADPIVLEDSGPATVAAWATNMSPGPPNEAGQALTFNVTANDNPGLFSTAPAVDAISGDLTFTPTDDANGVANVTLVLMDDGGGDDTSAPHTIVITVTGVNDIPSFTAPADHTVAEDVGPVSTAFIVDGSAGPSNESGQTLTYIISANSNEPLFSELPAVAADGTLTYTPADDINGTATITLSLMDNGGTADGGMDTTADQTFDIIVTAVNDTPSFAKGPDVAFSGPAMAQTEATWATAISPGAPNESGQVLTFNVTDNSDPSLFDVLPAVDAVSGDLTYTPNAAVAGFATITLDLMDDGGGADTSAPQTFVISIGTLNNEPTFVAGGNETELEDSGMHTAPAWATAISDGDGGVQTLTFMVSNDNNGLFSMQPDVDEVSGDLTYTLAADEFGVANVSVFLMDNAGTGGGGDDTSPTVMFTITATSVNDIPSFTAPANDTVAEDVGPVSVAFIVDGSAGPTNESGQTLTFSISANSNEPLFSTLPAVAPNGTLSYTPTADSNGTATITLSLMDNGGTAAGGLDTTASQSFDIIVTAVNDTPSFTKGPDVAFSGPAMAQTEAGWATGMSPGPADESGQILTFNVTGNTDPSLFAVLPAVNAISGDLTYTPNAAVSGFATITLELMDDGGGTTNTSAPQSFVMNIGTLNNEPTFVAGGNQTELEDTGMHTAPAWATAISDGDGNTQTLTFMVSNDNNGLFSTQPDVDEVSGNLTYTLAADGFGVANVSVFLMDDGGTGGGGDDTSPTAMFTITATGINDIPSFTAPANHTVAEDAAAVTTAFIVDGSTGPANESGQTLTYTISANTNMGLFSALPAVASDGTLTYTPTADISGTATLTISLMDNGGTSNGGMDTTANQNFDIIVTAVNDTPSFTKGPDVTFSGLAMAQTEAGWATGMSPGPADESGQILTFNVTGNTDPSLFAVLPAVNAISGDLTYTPNAAVSGSATITLVLMDDGGGAGDTSAPQSFVMNIGTLNNEPSFVAGGNQTELEDTGMHTASAWATAISDGDGEVQTLTFMVSNDNNGLFSTGPDVDEVSGDLTYTLAADGFGVANVSVFLMDDGGTGGGGDDTSPTVMFTITATGINDIPSFTAPANHTVAEDATPVSVAFIADGSPGPSNESAQTLTYTISANSNMGLFSALPAVASDGTLTYTPTAALSGTATLTISLMDNGGTANGGMDTTAVQNFDIIVTAVNDEPSFSAGGNQTELEDTGMHTASAWATAISDGDGNTQILTFMVSNDNNGLFSTQPDVDEVTGDLTYTLAADGFGVANVSVFLMDDGGTGGGGDDTSPTVMFTITATGVNDIPSFTAPANHTVAEDVGPVSVAFIADGSAGPASESAQTLTYTISANTNMGLFSALPAVASDGTLTYTPTADISGTATLTISLMDNGGTSNGGMDTTANQNFDIVVTAVNDAPSFTAGADVSFTGLAAAQTEAGWATAISPGPADEAAQVLTFNVTANTSPGLFSVQPAVNSASGDLTYTPAATMSGTTTLTLDLMDNGGGTDTSASVMFTITVNTLNLEPTFTPGADQTVLEDSGTTTDAGWATAISDNNGNSQILTFMVSNDNNGLFSTQPDVDEASGDLTFTVTADVSGTANVSVFLMDNGGTAGGGDDTSPTSMFTITVTEVNDVPTFTVGADQMVSVSPGPQTVVGFIADGSPGPAAESGQTLTYLIDSNTNAGLFSAGPAVASNGTLTYTPTAATSGSATIGLRLMDNGGGTDTSAAQTFSITVAAANVAPVVTGESFDVIVNTVFENSASPGTIDSHPQLHVAGNLLSNDTDGGDGPMAITASLFSQATMGAAITVNADGTFTYRSAVGDATGSDSFVYAVSDGMDTSNGTVTITHVGEIWFVENNDGGGVGTADDPFVTLAEAEAVAGAGDTIFVHTGDGLDTGQDSGVTLAFDNLRLIGEGVALTVTGTLNMVAGPHTLFAAGTKPLITSAVMDNETITVVDVTGVEISGFTIESGEFASMRKRYSSTGGLNPMAKRATTNGANSIRVIADTANTGVTITNNAITEHMAGGEVGIFLINDGSSTLTAVVTDNTINAGDAGLFALTGSNASSATIRLSINDNTNITANFEGILIDGTLDAGMSTIFIDSFRNNTIHQDTADTGILIDTATFDGDLDDGQGDFDVVDWGTTVVGNSGMANGVNGSGIVLTTVSGDISFSSLDIVADAGSGLKVAGTGTFVMSPGSGFRITTTAGTIVADGGPGLDLDPLTAAVTLTSVTAGNSPTTGISLSNLDGSVTINGGALSTIAGSAFEIVGGTVSSTYSGNITQTNNAAAVSVSGGHSTGTVTFDTGTISASNGTGLQFDNADSTASYSFTGSVILNGGDAGIDILNDSDGSFNFSAFSSITNPSGTGFRVDQGAGTIAYSGTVTNNAGRAVEITNRGGGSVTLSGAINDTGATGILVMNNSSGSPTVNFTGEVNITNSTGTGVTVDTNAGAVIGFSDLDITNTSSNQAGLFATATGTLNVTAGVISTGSGRPVDIDNSGLGVTLTSVTCTGAVAGIDLNTTSGSFTVTGDGMSADSGGVILNPTTHGVLINSASNITLGFMRIQNPTMNGIKTDNMSGSGGLNNVVVTAVNAASTSGLDIDNTNTNLTNFTVDTCTFSTSATTRSMFLVEGRGTSILTVIVQNSTFTGLNPVAFQATSGLASGDTPTLNITFDNNTVENAAGVSAISTVELIKAFGGSLALTVSNNTIRNIALNNANAGLVAVAANSDNSGGSLTGTISGNTIENSPGRRGISISSEPATGTVTLVDITIDNNDINELTNREAIHISMRNDTPLSHFRITNNRIGTKVGSEGDVGGTRDGMFIQARNVPAKTMNLLIQSNTIRVNNTGTTTGGDNLIDIDAEDSASLNATILGNTITNDGTGVIRIDCEDPGATICIDLNASNTLPNTCNTGIFLDHSAGTYSIEGIGAGGPFTNAQVEAFLDPLNNTNVLTPDGNNFIDSAGCGTPP